MALGLGGNAVTVSNALWALMAEHGATADLDATTNGGALAAVIKSWPGGGRPRFAVVHPYSGHNYELRYWLAGCGVDPERDIEIVILPPPFMPEALASGALDGYCVGAPWNAAAVALGVGHIATAKARIWRSSPEKVLGAQERWADENPDALSALLRALYRAASWCANPANRPALAGLMAEPAYVARPVEWLLPALLGEVRVSADATVRIEDFFVPLARGATFPWKSHALWFYTQMARWGQIEHTSEHEAIARETYRPDLYRAALKPLGAPLPAANYKVEGALTAPTPVGASGATLTLGPDGFFDGGLFDPDHVAAYIEDARSRDSGTPPSRV
jgi:two-component system, oxyanion-binding sensor